MLSLAKRMWMKQYPVLKQDLKRWFCSESWEDYDSYFTQEDREVPCSQPQPNLEPNLANQQLKQKCLSYLQAHEWEE